MGDMTGKVSANEHSFFEKFSSISYQQKNDEWTSLGRNKQISLMEKALTALIDLGGKEMVCKALSNIIQYSPKDTTDSPSSEQSQIDVTATVQPQSVDWIDVPTQLDAPMVPTIHIYIPTASQTQLESLNTCTNPTDYPS